MLHHGFFLLFLFFSIGNTANAGVHFFSNAGVIKDQTDCRAGVFKRFEGKPPPTTREGIHTDGYYMPFGWNLGKLLKSNDCYRFTYMVDGVSVEGWVTKPKKMTREVKYPVIIYNRGGNTRNGLIDANILLNIHLELADKGFIVISSQYRGAAVWPKDYSGDIGKDEFGGRDVEDVKALFPILDGIPDADLTRIGMYGFSRGGMMTYLAAKNNPRIKAMVVVAGVTDELAKETYRADMERLYATLIPDFSKNREELLKARSVIYWADQLPLAPLLLMHGTNDDRVHASNSIRLAEKLEQLGRPHKLLLFPGAHHGFIMVSDKANEAVVEWFKVHLK